MKQIEIKLKNFQGFTLIELMIGIFTMVIIMGAVYGVLYASIRSQQYNFENSTNTQDGRQIILEISKEIKNAVQISFPSVGNTDNIISYRKDSDNADRSISFDIGSNEKAVVFTDSDGNIIRTLGTGRIQMLHFKRDSLRSITINLTIQNSVGANAPTNSLSTIVYTLNTIN